MDINRVDCAVGGANTGFGDCVLTLGGIKKAILVSPDFVFDPSVYATPELAIAALVSASQADLPSDRIYPLSEIVGITNNSEGVVTQTLGNGTPVVVRDGMANWLLQYTDGGNCVSNALRRFNRRRLAILFIDDNGVLFGTKVGQTIKGIPLAQFYALPFGVNDFANIANFSFQVIFNPSYINEDLGFIQLPLGSLMQLTGLENINLVLSGARAVNVVNVQAVTGCSKLNLYDEYSAELVVASNWKASMNGKAVAIDTVALNADSKAFTVTLDDDDPNYVVGAPIVLTLAAPSVLEGNGVVGFEGVPLNIA